MAARPSRNPEPAGRETVPLRVRIPPVPAPLRALADLWSLLGDLMLAALALLCAVNAWAPPQDLPWKPLRLDQPAGLATPMKFASAAGDSAMCRRVLADGGVRIAEVPPRRYGACAVVDAVRVTGGLTPLRPAGAVMTCRQALALAFWDRHVVGPAAQAELGTQVAAIGHYGTYACRKIAGRDRLSEHAHANALDVAAFHFADGRTVTVVRDFRSDDARGRFLRRVRAGACPWFRAVLSPDYNAAHRDHLHLDFGRFGMCR